jgi:TolA-binding protein
MKLKSKVIIFFLFACVFISGCADDQYSVERKYYRAQKQAEKIFLNSKSSPSNEVERVVSMLEGFADKYPNTTFSVDAQFLVARIYLVKEEYEKSRGKLRQIMSKYPNSGILNSEALFLIGNTYERQDKWDQALNEYRILMEEYATAPKGLSTPMYIIQHYKEKFQPEKMRSAVDDAIFRYNGLIQKFPNSTVAVQSYALISASYRVISDWANSIKTLNTMVEKFSGKINMDSVLMDIALIYKKELRDSAKSKEVLERLIKEYPKSRFANLAKALLEKP